MEKKEIVARVDNFIKHVMAPAQHDFYSHINADDEYAIEIYQERKRDLEAMQDALEIVKHSDVLDDGEVKFSKDFFKVIFRQAMLQYMKQNEVNKQALAMLFGDDKSKVDKLYDIKAKADFKKLSEFYEILFNEKCKFTCESILADLQK